MVTPTPRQNTLALNQDLQRLLLVTLAAAAYYGTFRLNQHLDPWVLYGQGIALVFLPAGIKHVAILVACGWGALGCFAALMWLSFEFWHGIAASQAALYSGLSTLASWAGIWIGMRLLGIASDLENLRFIHLPLLDLITTAVHGFVVNAYFIAVGMKQQELLANALAMMFGDYAGSFIVLTCLWLCLLVLRRLQRTN